MPETGFFPQLDFSKIAKVVQGGDVQALRCATSPFDEPEKEQCAPAFELTGMLKTVRDQLSQSPGAKASRQRQEEERMATERLARLPWHQRANLAPRLHNCISAHAAVAKGPKPPPRVTRTHPLRYPGAMSPLTKRQQLKRDREGLYWGQCRDDMRHGEGRQEWTDGRRYEGQWAYNQRNGNGMYCWSDGGCSYTGQWRNSVPHGAGHFEWADGQMYNGEWCKGVRHGKGTQTWPDGGCYVGTWTEGQPDKIGRHTYADGSEYFGGWESGHYFGMGTHVWADGSSYEGMWLNDRRQGEGQMTWPDKSEYKGHWKDGQRHGKGFMRWARPLALTYEGQWHRGMRHGKGVQQWADGGRYDGGFKKDLQHGKGKLEKPDGSIVHGIFDSGDIIEYLERHGKSWRKVKGQKVKEQKKASSLEAAKHEGSEEMQPTDMLNVEGDFANLFGQIRTSDSPAGPSTPTEEEMNQSGLHLHLHLQAGATMNFKWSQTLDFEVDEREDTADGNNRGFDVSPMKSDLAGGYEIGS